MKKDDNEKRMNRGSVSSAQSQSLAFSLFELGLGAGMNVKPKTQQLRTSPARASIAPCQVKYSIRTRVKGPMTNIPTPDPHVVIPEARALRSSKYVPIITYVQTYISPRPSPVSQKPELSKDTYTLLYIILIIHVHV